MRLKVFHLKATFYGIKDEKSNFTSLAGRGIINDLRAEMRRRANECPTFSFIRLKGNFIKTRNKFINNDKQKLSHIYISPDTFSCEI